MKKLKNIAAWIASISVCSLAVKLWFSAAESGMEFYMIVVCVMVSLIAAGLSYVAFVLADL